MMRHICVSGGQEAPVLSSWLNSCHCPSVLQRCCGDAAWEGSGAPGLHCCNIKPVSVLSAAPLCLHVSVFGLGTIPGVMHLCLP